MRTIAAASLISLLLFISGCIRKGDDRSDIEAIKKSAEDYSKAVKGRNSGLATSMMSDNILFAQAHAPAAKGKEEVRKLLTGMFERLKDFNTDFRISVKDVHVSGDLGVAHGTWNLQAIHKEQLLSAVNDSGSWAIISHRQSDGTWKWDSVTINSDHPLPGTTPDGADEQALVKIEKDMAGGQIQNRAQALGSMQNAFKLESIDIKDIHPRVFEGFATVTLTGAMKGTWNGKQSSGTLHGVDFFVKRDGDWHLVYSQNTTTVP